MKLTNSQFLQAKAFLLESGTQIIPQLEVRVNEQWGSGSRQVIYTALRQETFEACSLTEKIIYVEALEMMAETPANSVGDMVTA